MLADSRTIVALDLVEVNPVLDERNATAILAAELAASAFGMNIL
jgi:arginase